MNWKAFWDCPEELFIGAFLQFPLYFVIHWWIAPVMVITALLWRWGGVEGGEKLARKIGVPLVVCGSAFLFLHSWWIFLAVPFMIWLCPFSYGKSGWLYKWLKSDLHVRLIGYFWYWSVFFVFSLIK